MSSTELNDHEGRNPFASRTLIFMRLFFVFFFKIVLFFVSLATLQELSFFFLFFHIFLRLRFACFSTLIEVNETDVSAKDVKVH